MDKTALKLKEQLEEAWTDLCCVQYQLTQKLEGLYGKDLCPSKLLQRLDAVQERTKNIQDQYKDVLEQRYSLTKKLGEVLLKNEQDLHDLVDGLKLGSVPGVDTTLGRQFKDTYNRHMKALSSSLPSGGSPLPSPSSPFHLPPPAVARDDGPPPHSTTDGSPTVEELVPCFNDVSIADAQNETQEYEGREFDGGSDEGARLRPPLRQQRKEAMLTVAKGGRQGMAGRMAAKKGGGASAHTLVAVTSADFAAVPKLTKGNATLEEVNKAYLTIGKIIQKRGNSLKPILPADLQREGVDVVSRTGKEKLLVLRHLKLIQVNARDGSIMLA
ncbi:unnamed protein product [Vitrella brassicaformis CCMP3155]|uniref:Ska2 N-terminal domain-containing protein n=1 Tax=Vitrella brassicaformis (strain CCMP3155) TaxID=1169540 RepID=A0A0G4EXD4_VITBC|nr:unnamed protein product [Vitrella brassicaformis CCMP3155]|eukprot:CEM03458.1 unnamed protein product [Vitrella brassicaformis CCMP3155]